MPWHQPGRRHIAKHSGENYRPLDYPVMDGFTATQRIREKENETQRHIPIIAVTANVMPEVREACMQLGVDDYLSKPVTLQNLITILETWLVKQKVDL